jgi:PilZ domain
VLELTTTFERHNSRAGDYRTRRGHWPFVIFSVTKKRFIFYLPPTPLRPMLIKRNFRPLRRSPRQWLNTSVQVFAGPAHFDGLGVNLSNGGMCLFTIANLPVGTQLEVEFVSPQSEEPVRLPGKVRHRALYLYGIEFEGDASEPRGDVNRGQVGIS